MSEVLKATDAELGRTVAVKLLDDGCPAADELTLRFAREARAAAQLSGEEHAVTIYDVGVWNGRPFIVMEYLAGGSLDDVLRVGARQPPALALNWVDEAAAALDHAHASGIVHRDVKPANLLLDERRRLHVADFGIASAVDSTWATRTGTVLGTAGYLSPEQAQGKPAGPAADQYSLGVVAFELLTGQRPFRRDSFTAEAAAHVHAPVPSASRIAHGLPAGVDAVFERALAKDPAARFSSCSELADALRDAFAATDGAARRIADVAAADRVATSRRSRMGAILAGLIALLLVAGASLATALRDRHAGSVAATTVAAKKPKPRPTAAARAVALDRQARATADWNLTIADIRAGRCGDALALLDRARAAIGERAQLQLEQLDALCAGRQPPQGPPGRDRGHGQGHGHDHAPGHGPGGDGE